MKNLFYKELKLNFTPVIFVFLGVFLLMIPISQNDLFVPFIYVCAAYPMVFLGANKGQPANDLYYSLLLPIRKKDIVIARMLFLTFLQLVVTVLGAIFIPLTSGLAKFFRDSSAQTQQIGFGSNTLIAFFGFMFIAYALLDLLYFVFYYKKGKSVLAPTLLGMLVFIVVLMTFTFILPLCIPVYLAFFVNNLWAQFIVLAVGIGIAILIKLVAIKIGSNRLEKADF